MARIRSFLLPRRRMHRETGETQERGIGPGINMARCR